MKKLIKVFKENNNMKGYRLSTVKDQHIINAYRANNYNATKTSKKIGVSRGTIVTTVRKYGIDTKNTWRHYKENPSK